MEALLEARQVSKKVTLAGREATILAHASVHVRPGEFVGLVGPSGCGKSTLLNILGLADRATSGEVLIGGVPTSQATELTLRSLRSRSLGYVFQHFNLLSTLTARENVMVPLVLQGVSVQEAQAKSEEALALVGLSERSGAMPYTLSGGEMQRVAVARAIVHRPLVILADEPTGNLDSGSGATVLQLLKDRATRGSSILMATHSETAVSWCSRVIRMKDGVIEG